jgi:methyl-accepting chemotaxis protein
MLNKFMNLKISDKIIGLVAAGATIIAVFLLINVLGKVVEYRHEARLSSFSKVTRVILDTVRQIQLERGASVTYLVESSDENKSSLDEQRKKTDSAKLELEAILKQRHFKLIPETRSDLDRLVQVRADVNEGLMTAEEVLSLFSGIVGSLLNDIEQTFKANSDDKDLVIAGQTLVNFAFGRDNADQELSQINIVLSSGESFTEDQLQFWGRLKENQTIHFNAYATAATGGARKAYQAFEKSQSNLAMLTLAETILEQTAGGTITVPASEWNQVASARVTELKGIEDGGVQFFLKLVDQLQRKAMFIVVINLLLLVIILVLVVAVSTKVIASITGPLKEMQQAALNIVESGDFSKRIKIESEDEVGQTGKAFNDLLDSLQFTIADISRVMSAIASGDLRQRIQFEVKGDLLTVKEAINITAETLKQAIEETNVVMSAIAAGNLMKRMDIKVSGEFAVLSESINSAAETLQAAFSDINQVMMAVASGDLKTDVTVVVKGELNSLKESINTTVDALRGTMALLADQSSAVATAATEAARAVESVSEGTQSQVQSVEQIARAIDQTAESVMEVTRSTEVASQSANTATSMVEKSQLEMRNMKDVMSKISDNSEKINKITEVIGGIANQTNLLALNAAIEAARAGEHGKGFAVVAEEVRKLAENSANSVHEITELVSQAVKEAGLGVQTSEVVYENMNKVSDAVIQTDDMLQRIAATMEETSAAMEQVSANIANLRTIGETSASAAEEITATVAELSELAVKSQEQVNKYKV